MNNENIVIIADDPREDGYQRLIDYAIERCYRFVLVVRDFDLNEEGQAVLKRLEPYLDARVEASKWPGTMLLKGTAQVYYYRCHKDAAIILKESARSLFSWRHPNLPEDLSFLTKDNQEWLVSVAHERMGYLNIDEAERKRISDSVTGLFLRGSFNEEISLLLKDAKVHKVERLEIEGFGIDELPPEICELTELKYLRVFEGEINKLPDGFERLSKLEELSILSKDIPQFPTAICKLKNLKRLEILCASQIIDDAEAGEIKPLGKSIMSELPKEIGQLTNLESISINATSIKKLPKEIKGLKKLKDWGAKRA